MPLKLTKEESTRKSTFEDLLRKATENLISFPDDDTMEAYNDVSSDLTSFLDEIASRLRDEYDEKSEKWQESDAAMEVDQLIENWESCSIDLIEDVDDVDEDSLNSTLDIFENLPEDIE